MRRGHNQSKTSELLHKRFTRDATITFNVKLYKNSVFAFDTIVANDYFAQACDLN